MLTKTEIEKIQGIIEKDQENKIKLETQIQSEYDYLKKEYGLKSLDEVEKELDEIDKELTDLEKDIETRGDALKEAYDWGI